MGVLDYVILKDGLPIYTINIDAKKGISNDQTRFTLVSGFLSAISSFVDSMNKLGQVEEMQMSSEISFFFQRSIMKTSEMLFIVVTSSDMAKSQAKWVLETATTNFLDKYLDTLISFDGNISVFQPFNSIFTAVIKDSNQIPSDLKENLQDSSVKPLSLSPNSLATNSVIKSIRPRLRGYTRFNRYRILKGFQSQFRDLDIPEAKMILGNEDVPWASQEGWSSLGDCEGSNHTQDSSPDFSSDFNGNEDAPVIDNEGALSQINMRHSISAILRGSDSNQSSSKKFTISELEKIPWKEPLPKTVIPKVLTTPWKQAVYNAINGQVSVRELANIFGVKPPEILETCHELATMGIITFKE